MSNLSLKSILESLFDKPEDRYKPEDKASYVATVAKMKDRAEKLGKPFNDTVDGEIEDDDQLNEAKKSSPKTLYKSEWLSLMSTPEKSGDPYIYSHETRCNGNIVAVLLYERAGRDAWNYGVRSEQTPCWGNEEQLSSLTGGVDKGSTPIETAIKEIEEESGFICKKSDLKPLGTCRGTKSTDTLYHLFALDVSGLKKTKPTGEDKGKIVWVCGLKEMEKVVCPVFYAMFVRLGLY